MKVHGLEQRESFPVGPTHRNTVIAFPLAPGESILTEHLLLPPTTGDRGPAHEWLLQPALALARCLLQAGGDGGLGTFSVSGGQFEANLSEV